jgi:hypothetical protein
MSTQINQDDSCDMAKLAVWRVVLVVNQFTRWSTPERSAHINEAASELAALAQQCLAPRFSSWLEHSNLMLALLQRRSGGYAIPVADEHREWARQIYTTQAKQGAVRVSKQD